MPVTSVFEARPHSAGPITRSIKPAPRKRDDRTSGKPFWLTVAGFSGATYVYGQLQFITKSTVAGYLYPTNRGQIYVYGEVLGPREFRVFDNRGTLYQLSPVSQGTRD